MPFVEDQCRSQAKAGNAPYNVQGLGTSADAAIEECLHTLAQLCRCLLWACTNDRQQKYYLLLLSLLVLGLLLGLKRGHLQGALQGGLQGGG